MAMHIGNAIAEHLSLGEWQAGEGPRPVYYFDAEMNLADVQERMRIIGITSEKFFLLSNERLFLTGGRGVNIADPLHQTKLSEMLPEGSIFIGAACPYSGRHRQKLRACYATECGAWDHQQVGEQTQKSRDNQK